MDQTVSRLVIDVTTEARDATAGFADVAQHSQRMAADVEDAGARAARGLNVTADSTDELASKSSQATGALGALASGFELVGLEKYSTGLQAAAMGTDFFSGVGDAANLVLESTAVKSALARANMLRQAVTSRIVAGATRVWAGAQWAMNAALNANPIGLVVAAVALLVAGIVLAYKRSETFRNIIQAVGRIGRTAVGWVVDKVSDLVTWVKVYAPAGFDLLKSRGAAAARFLLSPFTGVIDKVKECVTWVKVNLPAGFDAAKRKAGEIKDSLVKPFSDVLGIVKDIIDWIKKIHVPDVNPFGRIAPTTDVGRVVSSDTAARVVTSPVIQVTFQTTVQGAVDAQGTATTIERVQRKQLRRLGLVEI